MTLDITGKAKTAKFQELIKRQDKILVMMHPPTAFHGKIMEKAGAEALFVGTAGVVGAYTGMIDVGVANMMECVQVGGWVARAVGIPVMLDGDTGHGGVMAVRRLVQECIRAGIAGLRIDDQPIEGKRRTGSAGIEVAPIDQVIARYRAAVDAKNEIDPNFVIMAQCYARDASNSSLDDCLKRMAAYKKDAGVDWVQLEAPHNVDEIKQARKAVPGAFSFMKGPMPRFLSLKEHKELGVNIAWYPGFLHQITWHAVWDFMQAFKQDEIGAWEAFRKSREGKSNPPDPGLDPAGESLAKQRELEEKYFSPEALAKYR
jgi:2-methylisocitrate lyase-like PEP mutase family enzyme